MAELFQESSTRRSATPIVISILVLVLLAAAGGFFYFKHNDHPFAHAEITQVQVMPIHMAYTHELGTDLSTNTDQDATYVVAHVAVTNRFDAPLFLKNMVVDVTTADGQELHSTALEKSDIARVAEGFKQIKPLLTEAGGKPLLREITIAPNATAEGYIVVQYPVEQKAWLNRQASTLRLDFYHNSTLTTAFPK